MGSYVPSTGAQREEMLRAVGVGSTRELFRAATYPRRDE